ncbi:hypothetical protein Gotur_017329 [Gossypium turneri]
MYEATKPNKAKSEDLKYKFTLKIYLIRWNHWRVMLEYLPLLKIYGFY